MPIPPFVPSEDVSSATCARAADILFSEFQKSGFLSHPDAVSVLRKAFGHRFYENTDTGSKIDPGVLNAFRNLYKTVGGHWYAQKMFWKVKPGMRPEYKPLASESGMKMRFRARM